MNKIPKQLSMWIAAEMGKTLMFITGYDKELRAAKKEIAKLKRTIKRRDAEVDFQTRLAAYVKTRYDKIKETCKTLMEIKEGE